MGMTFYRFRSDWQLAGATTTAVYQVLADVQQYPGWWPQVRSVRQIDENSGAMEIRSTLPYTLRVVATREIEDEVALRLRASLSGDIDGWSEWQIRTSEEGCTATFCEEVIAGGRLAVASRTLRPMLEWNHARMMRSGEVGLRRRLSALPSDEPH
jgi:hypothetical protein